MHLITTITIQATPETIWQAMFNPHLLGQCLPGLTEWQEIEPQQSYRLLLTWSAAQEGPHIQASMLVRWKEAQPFARIGWEATLFLGSQALGLEGNVSLEPNGAGVQVTLEAVLAAPSPIFSQMGNQVAPKILQPFFKCLRACLEATAVAGE